MIETIQRLRREVAESRAYLDVYVAKYRRIPAMAEALAEARRAHSAYVTDLRQAESALLRELAAKRSGIFARIVGEAPTREIEIDAERDAEVTATEWSLAIQHVRAGRYHAALEALEGARLFVQAWGSDWAETQAIEALQ